MGSGIYIASAGATTQSDALDVTANNVANASTAGYKAVRVSFGEVLGRARSQDASFVSVAETAADTADGAIRRTDNPLDLALVGDGYFGVQTPQGARYTRAGNFQILDGNLVSSEGYAARAVGGGLLEIPEGASDVRIDETGVVFADDEEVGALELSVFEPGVMAREGANLYSTGAAPIDGDGPSVVSGALESSNVNVIRGVVDLVRVSRTYESLMRMIEGYSKVESRAARELGGS